MDETQNSLKFRTKTTEIQFAPKKKMASQLSVILLVTLAIAINLSQTNADCCRETVEVNGEDICYDGTIATPYCGHGPCNIFGCNCDGGCRKNGLNSEEEARRLFYRGGH